MRCGSIADRRGHLPAGDHGIDEAGLLLAGLPDEVFGCFRLKLPGVHKHARDPGQGRLKRLGERGFHGWGESNFR